MSAAAVTTLPIPVHSTTLAPGAVPGLAISEMESARVRLNVALKDVVQATQRNCEHANLFQSVVPVDQITDYHLFVDPRNATMCLEQISSRTSSCFYTSVQEFRREYEQVLANALAYNSPGHGRHAYKPIIAWAQDLLDVCCDELHCRQGSLAAIERDLQEALTTSRQDYTFAKDAYPSPSPKGQMQRRRSNNICPLSSLEALVAACELAAEQEGLEEEDMHYYDDVCGAARRLHAQPEPQPEPEPEIAAAGLGVEADQQQPGPAARVKEEAKREGSGTEGGGVTVGAARAKGVRSTGYDAAPKYRRHKSKVYIRPNKVVYLPTTFMEENFDPSSLPVNCEMIVETNGTVQPDRHMVSIKSVPRQGLSTMYCMTNVMKFQQRFLNWQILNWTKVDDQHIKIHLQGPSGGSKGSRDVEGADAGPASLHKRKGGRDVCDSGAACDEDDDAMDTGELGDGSAGGFGHQHQQEDRTPALDNAKSCPPLNTRGQPRRLPSTSFSHHLAVHRCASAPAPGLGMGLAGEACIAAAGAAAAPAPPPCSEAEPDPGSGSSSPSHHDGHHQLLMLPMTGTCARSQGSREGDGGARRSPELHPSPANSTGNSGAQLQQLQALALTQQQQQQHQHQQVQAVPPPYQQAVQYTQHGFPFCLPFWSVHGQLAGAGSYEDMSAVVQPMDPQLHFDLLCKASVMMPQQAQGVSLLAPGALMSCLSGLTSVGAACDMSAAGLGYKRCKVDGMGGADAFACLSPTSAPAPGTDVAAAAAAGLGLFGRSKRPTDVGEVGSRAAKLHHALSL